MNVSYCTSYEVAVIFYKVMAKYGKTKAFYSIKPILIAA